MNCLVIKYASNHLGAINCLFDKLTQRKTASGLIAGDKLS